MQRFKIVSDQSVYIGDRFISHGSGSVIELLSVDSNGVHSVVLLPALKIDSIFRIEDALPEN